MLVRKGLKVEKVHGNEYIQTVCIALPDGLKLHVSNVYLPPSNSLTRRGLKEIDAREQVQSVLEAVSFHDMVVVAGDFNTRVGTLSPCIDGECIPRTTLDKYQCPRAAWLV